MSETGSKKNTTTTTEEQKGEQTMKEGFFKKVFNRTVKWGKGTVDYFKHHPGQAAFFAVGFATAVWKGYECLVAPTIEQIRTNHAPMAETAEIPKIESAEIPDIDVTKIA